MIQKEVTGTPSVGGIHEMIVVDIEDQKTKEMISILKLRCQSIITAYDVMLSG